MKRLVLVLLLLPRLGAAQAHLVKDIAEGPGFGLGSGVYQIVLAGSTIYFAATTYDAGTELWKTDGTARGTSLVADLRFGPRGSNPGPLRAFGSSLVFFASDDDGKWLWITRGTPATTTRLAVAAVTGFPDIAIVNGAIVFGGHDPVHDGLWVSDGTPSGTHPLLDLHSDTQPRFTVFGNQAAFLFSGGLWVTDGTAAGTRRVRGDVTFKPASDFLDVAAAGVRLFFVAGVGDGPFQLWVTDGTDAGTHTVPTANGKEVAQNIALLHALGDRVVFYARRFNGAFLGELTVWVTNGTSSTLLARDSVANGSLSMADRKGIVYFTLADTEHGNELWRTDGTPAGTSIAVDLVPGKGRGVSSVASLGDDLWLTDYTFDGRWRSDGTPAGTVHLSSVLDTPRAALNGRAFFSGYDLLHGAELWSTDGTPEGTSAVVNIQPDIAASSSPFFLAATRDRLFFAGWTSEYRLWTTDGTAEGTRSLFLWQDTSSPVVYHGALYFVVKSSELWRSDGTPEGTSLVETLPKIDGLFVAGDVLYIGGASLGIALWASDGTAAGTVPLGNTTLLAASKDFLGRLLVNYDTATDGTRPPRPFFTSPFSAGEQTAWWVGGGTIYMAGFDPRQSTVRFFKSHGAPNDASAIVTLTGVASAPSAAIATTTQLFFAVDDGAHGSELWRTDGTAAGTYLVKDIRGGSGSSSPDDFAVLDDRLLFTADDGVFGRELWISDGTPAGTRMVQNIAPLAASSIPRASSSIVVQNGIAWFMANDGLHGYELWRSDGTPAGTYLAADIEAGPLSSLPSPMSVVGGAMVVAATTIESGRELWAVPSPEVAISIADMRAAESARMASVVVSLSAPATEAVTAHWSVDNGAAGDLTIPAGQTRAEIAVPFADDGVDAGNRVLYFRLHDLRGAIAAKSVAAVLIEDSELRADVGIAFTFEGDDVLATVTNFGPSTATDVRAPAQLLGDMKAGASKRFLVARGGNLTVSTTVSAAENDPNPANDTATLHQEANGALSLAVIPAWLTPGVRGALHVSGNHDVPVHLTSSNPQVLAVPPSVIPPAQLEIVPLSAGTTTITAEVAGVKVALPVDVVPSGKRGRWPAHMTFTIRDSGLYYGSSHTLTATITARTPDTRDAATGTVTFSGGGRVVAVVKLAANGVAEATVDNLLPALGPYEVVATYSGDAHFFPENVSAFTTVIFGPPKSISALLSLASANRGELTIVVKGFGGIVPTGTVTVSQGGKTLFEAAPLAGGVVTRPVVVDPSSAIVTVKYFGDSFYQPVTMSVPLAHGRTRTAR